jgi:hypothetical protein
MTEVQKFLSALRKEFDNMFIVREGAPIAEFWESFSLAEQEAAAPEMLAALQEALYFVEGFEDDDIQDVTTLLKVIRGAIHKAITPGA